MLELRSYDLNRRIFNDSNLSTCEKLFMVYLIDRYFYTGSNNNFYLYDDHTAQMLDTSRRNLIKVRKSLIDSNYISTTLQVKDNSKTLYYHINFNTLLNSSDSISIQSELPVATNNSTQEETKALSSFSNLLPPTPLTTTETENKTFETTLSQIGTFTPAEIESPSISLKSAFNDVFAVNFNSEINSKGQNEANKALSLQNDISISPEGESVSNRLKSVNTEVYKKVGVLDNIISAFTKEELIRWQDEMNRDEVDGLMDGASERVEQLSKKHRLEVNFVWNKLIGYIINTEFNTEVKETTQNEVDLDTVPAWIWDVLERVYLQNVTEIKKDEWGDDVEVVNKYLKPMDAIRAIYKATLKKYSTEDKKLLNQYAKVVYDDCAFAYGEYNG